MRHTARPGTALAAGLAASVIAAVAPAGLAGGSVPVTSFAIWGTVLVCSVVVMRSSEGSLSPAIRRIVWLLVPVLLLGVTASLLVPRERRLAVGAALLLRSLASASAAIATVAALGPGGIIRGLRALMAPALLVDVLHAMLVALTAVARQIAAMQRSRSARRARSAPLAALVTSPVQSVTGFGRIAGALFLRSVERAEALERARRARGGGGA